MKKSHIILATILIVIAIILVIPMINKGEIKNDPHLHHSENADNPAHNIPALPIDKEFGAEEINQLDSLWDD